MPESPTKQAETPHSSLLDSRAHALTFIGRAWIPRSELLSRCHPTSTDLSSAPRGDRVWASEPGLRDADLLPLTRSPQNVLSAGLTVLYWAFFSNCEAFSAQPGSCREWEEAKWKLIQTKFDFLPIAFAKQLKKMPARGRALSSSDENAHIIIPTGPVEPLALITRLRLNIFYGQKQ